MKQITVFSAHPKQDEFLEKVFTLGIRFPCYGGAAGGGKTIVGLSAITLLCRINPKGRGLVIRKSSTEIRLNTIPSFFKIVPKSYIKSFHNPRPEYVCTFKNDSEIIFRGENIDSDPELQWLDGGEFNWILLDQCEELSEATFKKAKLRVGRNVITPMPEPKILCTVNPTLHWPRKVFYEPYENNTLTAPYSYTVAKITDNPALPDSYIEGLAHLDVYTREKFIEGNWDVLEDVENQFAHQFDDKWHLAPVQINASKPLIISVDYNLNPFCVSFHSVWRDELGWHWHIFDEKEIKDSSIPEMGEYINDVYHSVLYRAELTGDYSGNNKDLSQADKASRFKQLARLLRIAPYQLKLAPNPYHKDSRELLNYILYHSKQSRTAFDFKINPIACPGMVRDFHLVQCNNDGTIIKANRSHIAQRADLMDTSRSVAQYYFRKPVTEHQMRRSIAA